MIDPAHIPPIADDELLARFIVNSNEYRKQDNTVKPKLFIPYKLVDLSVNRHRDSTGDEIWAIGSAVAEARRRTLYGRSDILASSCRIEPLEVVPRPLPGNSNHADVTGYPSTKEDQQSLAIKLAAAASKRLEPPN